MKITPQLRAARVITTPIGKLTVVASNKGISHIVFGTRPGVVTLPKSAEVPKQVANHIECAERQLVEYFAGKRKKFSLKLDLEGTEFQKAAWLALATIGFGQTISYAQQAARIAKPRAIRAVGSANGKNPIVIVLPCHRVIASDGTLGGFSGGLSIKRKLLAFELQN